MGFHCLQVHEKVVEYTWCTSESNLTCAEYLETNLGATDCLCRITFQLTDDFPVLAMFTVFVS